MSLLLGLQKTVFKLTGTDSMILSGWKICIFQPLMHRWLINSKRTSSKT